jgi:hypothetical protein
MAAPSAHSQSASGNAPDMLLSNITWVMLHLQVPDDTLADVLRFPIMSSRNPISMGPLVCVLLPTARISCPKKTRP